MILFLEKVNESRDHKVYRSKAATLEVEKDTTTIVASIVLGTGTTGFVGANRERLYRMKQGRKNTSPTNSDM